MNWESFWHMGGHAFYVWSTYGIALTALVACLLQPFARHRSLRRALAQNLERDPL